MDNQTTPDQLLKSAYDAWHTEIDRARRRYVRSLICVYDQDWRSLLDDHMRKLFSPETYADLLLKLDTSVNMIAWMASEIGSIYSEPATRTVDGEEREELEPYLNHGELDAALNEAAPLCFVTRELLIRPMVVERDGKKVFVLDLLTPDRCAAKANAKDPTKLDVLVVQISKTRWIVWSDEYCIRVDNQFKPVKGENDNIINDYGTIPYAPIFARYPSRGFWHEHHNKGLYDATMKIAAQMTNYGHLRHHQSFLQVWYRSDKDVKNITSIILDPAKALHLRGSQAQAGTIDLQANLRENLETIMQDATQTLALYGINPEAVRGKVEAQSGYALQIKNHKQQRTQNAYSRAWIRGEHRLYSVAQKVWAVDAPEAPQLPDGTLDIQMASTAPPQNPIEQADLAIKLKEAGWSEGNIYAEVWKKDADWIAKNEELRMEERANSGGMDVSQVPAEPDGDES